MIPTPEMIKAFWSKVEVQRTGAIHGLEDGLTAALALLPGETSQLQKLPAAFEVIDTENGTYLTRSEQAAINAGFEYNGLYRRDGSATAPLPVAVKARPSYDQVIDVVLKNLRRMHDAGESHRMAARWISEGLDKLYVASPVRGTEERTATVADCNAAFDPADEAFGGAFRDGFREGWLFAKSPDFEDREEAEEDYPREVDMALEALLQVVESAVILGGDEVVSKEAMEKVRAVIAKAEGSALSQQEESRG